MKLTRITLLLVTTLVVFVFSCSDDNAPGGNNNGGATSGIVITTTSATNITNIGAISGGNITSDGGSAIVARGVCWSITANPTIANSHTSDGSSVGVFTSNITGLTAGTLYYVRAYATNANTTGYGNQITITTFGGGGSNIVITTTSATNITNSSAISGGNITSDGGSAIIERGVCWSNTPNPTIANAHTTDGSSIGVFSSSLTGLTDNTLYYIRAYAINSNSTVYGNEVLFSTLLNCDTTNVTYNGTIKPLLQNSCIGCHNASSAGGGYNLTSYANDASGNMGVQSSALNGSLSGSVNHTGSFSHMPKGGSKLPQCKLDQIRIWVDVGAPNN
jgi:hypothetical protein